jgi:hypothetical protein
MGDWDKLGKKIIQPRPLPFVELFVPGAQIVSVKPVELEDADLEMDNLVLIQTSRKTLALINIEVQTYNDRKMARRLQRYNIETWEKYEDGFPVLSSVIYLLRGGEKPISPLIRPFEDLEVHRFQFPSEEIGEWPIEKLLEKQSNDLLPFLPLTRGGLERKPVEETLDHLYALGEERLIGNAITMASLAYQHYEKREPAWFIRKRYLMQESLNVRDIPFIQDMIQLGLKEGHEEGHEEGLKEGLKEGLEEGLKEGLKEGREEGLASLREVLLELVQDHFPTLSAQAREQASQMHAPETLKEAIRKVGRAASPEEAQQALLNWGKAVRKRRKDQGS